jgi:hypothetical protein
MSLDFLRIILRYRLLVRRPTIEGVTVLFIFRLKEVELNRIFSNFEFG